MTWWMIVLIVLAVDAIIIPCLFYGVISGYWQPLEKRFPARDALPGAVRKEFQSIKLDLFNLGWCTHISVDEQHMHLDPVLLLRWFKAGRISLPWESLELERVGRSWGKAKLRGGITLWAPAWAMRLAQTPSPDPSNEKSRSQHSPS